jgi:uncharacterized membrane protein
VLWMVTKNQQMYEQEDKDKMEWIKKAHAMVWFIMVASVVFYSVAIVVVATLLKGCAS